MCDRGVDETGHLMLECKRYERARADMMIVFLNELGHRINVVDGRTGCEWIVLLLGLNGVANGRMIEAVKEFLEKV